MVRDVDPVATMNGGREREPVRSPETPVLQAGARYLVVHTLGERRLHESVVNFLAFEDGHYVFDARPEFGTQRFPALWVRGIYAVDPRTKGYINRRHTVRPGA